MKPDRAMLENPMRGRGGSGRAAAMLVALALAMTGLAACGGGGTGSSSSRSGSSDAAGAISTAAKSGPGVGRPAVAIGNGSSAEESVLGELYAQALRAKGFTVRLRGGIGDPEKIYEAFRSGQIDMYPEYTGVFLSAVAGQAKPPASAVLAYTQAKAYAERHGFTMLNYTPFAGSTAGGAERASGSHNVAPVLRPSTVAKEGPAFMVTINVLSKLLTNAAMRQMNAAVATGEQAPAVVAARFLKAHGLA